jgi:hypothetical protein
MPDNLNASEAALAPILQSSLPFQPFGGAQATLASRGSYRVTRV